jgi:hypothetical protein
VATVVVASWEDDLDHARAVEVLSGRVSTDAVLEMPETTVEADWKEGVAPARAA